MKTIEILIVEDEPKLAQTVGDFLRIQNYDVKIVEDGTGALECFREKKQQIDLDIAGSHAPGHIRIYRVKRDSKGI